MEVLGILGGFLIFNLVFSIFFDKYLHLLKKKYENKIILLAGISIINISKCPVEQRDAPTENYKKE